MLIYGRWNKEVPLQSSHHSVLLLTHTHIQRPQTTKASTHTKTPTPENTLCWFHNIAGKRTKKIVIILSSNEMLISSSQGPLQNQLKQKQVLHSQCWTSSSKSRHTHVKQYCWQLLCEGLCFFEKQRRKYGEVKRKGMKENARTQSEQLCWAQPWDWHIYLADRKVPQWPKRLRHVTQGNNSETISCPPALKEIRLH